MERDLDIDLEPGRSAFNRGEYFAAHELWEDVWRDLLGGERILVQGLIQIAAGLHCLQQHRRRPAVSLLRKGVEKLSRCAPGSTIRLPLDPLVRHVTHLLGELEAPGSRVAPTVSFIW